MGINPLNPVKIESPVKVERGLPNTKAVKEENKPQPKPVKKAIAKTTTPKTDTATAQKKDLVDKDKLKIVQKTNKEEKKPTEKPTKELLRENTKTLFDIYKEGNFEIDTCHCI